MQTNNSYIRLTITPDRITLKTRTPEEENDLSKHLDRFEKEFDEMPDVDKSQSFRGKLRGKHERSFHLRNNLQNKEIRIIV